MTHKKKTPLSPVFRGLILSNIAFNQEECGGVLFSVSMALSRYLAEENLGSDQLRIFLDQRSVRTNPIKLQVGTYQS